MSDTPRTDANVKRNSLTQICGNDLIYANFARQLERELAHAQKENEELRADMMRHEQMSCGFMDERDAFKQQRDRLAEALRKIAENAAFCNTDKSAMKHVRMSLVLVTQALAAVEGGDQ